MVTFLLPRAQTLEIAECPNRLSVVPNEKDPLRISFHRTSSKSPERVRPRTDSDGKPSRSKSTNRNSWFRSITSSFMSGGGSPRTESAPGHFPLDAPTHVRRRTRSLVDSKVFTLRTTDIEDPRLPDHMRRPELQLRRISHRDLPPSKSPSSTRSSSVDRTQKYPPWWPA